jgi:hypothetical protein
MLTGPAGGNYLLLSAGLFHLQYIVAAQAGFRGKESGFMYIPQNWTPRAKRVEGNEQHASALLPPSRAPPIPVRIFCFIKILNGGKIGGKH